MYAPLALIVALIVYGTLYPWHFRWVPGADPLSIVLHSQLILWDRWGLRDIAVNVLLYLPFGAAGFLALARRGRRRMWAAAGATLAGMLLSATLEMLQVYVPGRDPSLSDVASNTVGSAAGALTAVILGHHLTKLKLGRAAMRGRAPALLVLLSWAAFQLYPLVPSVTRSTLRAAAAYLLRPARVSPVEVWGAAAEWFAAGVVLAAATGARRRWMLPATAILVLAFRPMVVDRHMSLEEVLGAAAAALLWVAIPRPGAGLALGMLGSAIVLRELAPFRFAAESAPFSWIPFRASLETDWQSGAVTLLRKAYDYGATAWLLRALGVPYVAAGIGLAAALAVMEALQCYLPGRTPEITDSVLALAMAFLLARLWNRRELATDKQ